jgi:NADH:ubiquinone oxidoreductase subunit D
MNMGPQHPSAHGVFRAILTLEGETVVAVDAVIGYLHRCHEKLAETLAYVQYPSIASEDGLRGGDGQRAGVCDGG